MHNSITIIAIFVSALHDSTMKSSFWLHIANASEWSVLGDCCLQQLSFGGKSGNTTDYYK